MAGRKWKLIGCSVLASLLAAVPFGVFGQDKAGDNPSFIFGACTHFGQGKGLLKENLSVLKQAGIMALRDEISWGGCETVKGKLNISESAGEFVRAAAEQGIEPLLILDYANKFYDGGDYPRSPEAIEGFARYSEAIVTAFKGKCKYYQVWNEWDGGCGMPAQYKGKGDPQSYINLLKVVYPRIKKIDPSAVVISNSVCTGDAYLKSLLELDMLKFCDVVGLHTYNYSHVGTDGAPEKWYERMQGVDKMLREFSGGKEVPLFITEMGWPTHVDNSGSSQTRSADFLARLYILAKTMPFIKGIWWYDFQDDGWNPKDNESNFGTVRGDLTPKKSYYVLKDLAPVIKQAVFTGRIDVGDPKIWLMKFKAPDGQTIIAAWSTYTDDDWSITLKTDSEIKSKFSMACLGEGFTERSFMMKDWLADKKTVSNDTFRLTVRERPYLLKGDLASVSSAKVERRVFQESMRPKNRVVVVPEKIGTAASVSSKKTPEVYSFGEDRSYRAVMDPRKGKDDIDASFSMKWDESAIHLLINVSDDTFTQEFSGEETWKGDGLQIAFQPFSKGTADAEEHTDLDVALTKNGPVVYKRPASLPSALTNEIQAKITQNGKKTVYDLTIPVKAVNLPPLKAGTIFGFSVLVNDNDGKGRKGYLHWGDGIGHSKDPSLYNWITLEE